MTQEGRVRYVHTQSRPQCVGTSWEPPSRPRTPFSLSLSKAWGQLAPVQAWSTPHSA